MEFVSTFLKTWLRRSHTPLAGPSPAVIRLLKNSFPGVIVMGCEQLSSSKPLIGFFYDFHILFGKILIHEFLGSSPSAISENNQDYQRQFVYFGLNIFRIQR